MASDKLYQDIVTSLRTQELNDATFEKIAVRIANDSGVAVLPMPGGQDAGYDGAIVDSAGDRLPGPLVATMQKNAVANIRTNLSMHAATYPEAIKSAFFVTTRAKTNRQKQNLAKEAQRLGYRLLATADEATVAEYLYNNPNSCADLLGFRGVPSALSPLPPRRRQHWDIRLVALDSTLDRLRHLTHDMMLIGIPGSGKTSLLSHVSADNRGLFARTADRDRLATDLREHRPKAIFVDGLDDQRGAVHTLVSLREESGISFNIVVTAWREDDAIIELLGLSPDHRIWLDRLELDQLVDIVRQLGIVGPRALIYDIVHQAAGSAGLAVTLAMACLNGNVGEVATGKVLVRHVRTMLRNLSLDETKAEMALAAISVGGDAGMNADDVARAVGMNPLELARLLRDIDAGGVIRPSRPGNVSVQPEHLRSALVAENFYGSYPTSIHPVLDLAPSRIAMLHTLILVAEQGREPPELRALLTVADSAVFKAYAALGPEQCRWVISVHPEYISAVGSAALHYIPEEILPLLITAAKDNARPLHNTPDHPLRIIRDWCQSARPGGGAVIPRREMTVTSALRYLDATGDVGTASRVFAQALTTEYETSYPDPGRGMTITFEWGVIAPDEIAAITGLWRRCFESLHARSGLPWKTLLEAARNAGSGRPVDDESRVVESREAARRLCSTMARDILELAQGHPGVAYEARQLTNDHDGWPSASEAEQLYELLFDPCLGEDRHPRETEVAAQLTAIAETWSRGTPNAALDILRNLGAACLDVCDGPVEDRRYFLGHQLAGRVASLPWLKAALRHGLEYPIVSPLLRRVIEAKAPGWEDVAHSCIGTVSEIVAVEGGLLAGGPPHLLTNISPLLPKYVGLIRRLCIRNEVLPDGLHVLLSHDDDRVASEAAIYMWHGRQGLIDEAIRPMWRNALLRANHDSSLSSIFSAETSLAFEWLKRRIEANDWQTLTRRQGIGKGTPPLTDDQRVELLLALTESVRFHDLVGPLFGDSVDVFTRVLTAGGRESLCLMALGRPKDEVWAACIVASHNQGINAEDLARASTWLSALRGPESVALQRRIEEVAQYLGDTRAPIRTVARYMTELLTANRDAALANEREERIWGR